LTLRLCEVRGEILYRDKLLKFFQYWDINLDSSGVSKPSNSRSIEYTVRANGCLSNTVILSGAQKDRFLVEAFVDNQTDPIEDSE